MSELEAAGGNAVAADEEVQINSEVSTDAKANEGGEVDPQESQEHGERPKKSGYIRQKEKAERLAAEAEYWRNVALDNLKGKQPDTKPTKTDDDDPRPKKSDFIVDHEAQTYDPDKYEDALLAWNRRQTAKEVLSKIEEQKKAEVQKTERQKQQEAWEAKKEAARAKYEDFDEALEADVPVTEAISKVLLKSEHGADLAYYLGTHVKEAQEIAKMDALDTALALGRIEATLAQKEAEPEPPPAVTKATPPPQSLKKATAAKAVDIYDPELSYKEFVKAREASLRKGK